MRAIIFTNGIMDQWPADFELSLDTDVIIAADGGLGHCLAWGVPPHVVVGDLDSVDPADLERMINQGVEIIRHPVRKDETDLELALKLALVRKIREMVILGALGARWDMTLSSVMILAASYLEHAHVRLLDGRHEMICLRGGQTAEIVGRPGDLVSILPLAGVVEGVSLHGLEYPLSHATLAPGTTLGLSNVLAKPIAEIHMETGCLLVAVTHL